MMCLKGNVSAGQGIEDGQLIFLTPDCMLASAYEYHNILFEMMILGLFLTTSLVMALFIHSDGKVVLPLPSIEVLAEAALNSDRKAAVIHVLESSVVSWMKQVKVKHTL